MRQGILSDLLAVPSTSINADDLAREIAGGGQPTPEQSLRAAQLCDDRLDEAIAARRSVMVETVLSSDKLKRRVEVARTSDFEIALVYVTLRDGRLNVARVAQRNAQGGHDVPPDRVLGRRSRSHAQFEWFARRADIVLVFDNTAIPTYAAGCVGGAWDLANVDLLPDELATTIRTLHAEDRPH